MAHADIWPQRLPRPGRNPIGKQILFLRGRNEQGNNSLWISDLVKAQTQKPQTEEGENETPRNGPGGSSGKQMQSATPWRYSLLPGTSRCIPGHPSAFSVSQPFLKIAPVVILRDVLICKPQSCEQISRAHLNDALSTMPFMHMLHEAAVNWDKNLLFLRFLLNDNQDPRPVTVMFSSLPTGKSLLNPQRTRAQRSRQAAVPRGRVARTRHAAGRHRVLS